MSRIRAPKKRKRSKLPKKQLQRILRLLERSLRLKPK
jgi:hypothetical protein